MGKLTALLLGMASVLFISYYLLSVAYAPILNWLGPVFGEHLNLLMGLFYLLMGVPTNHPVLFGSLVLIAAIIGASSARVGRAIGVASLVLFLSWSMLVVAALAIFIPFSSGTGFSGISTASNPTSLTSGFPSPPPGTDLYSLINEPVIYRIFTFLSDSLSTGTSLSGSSPSQVFGTLFSAGMSLFLLSMIEHLVIIYGVSGVTAYLVHRYIFGGGKKGLAAPAEPLKPVVEPRNGEAPSASSKAAVIFLVAVLLGSAIVMAAGSPSTRPSETSYSQGAVAAEMYGVGTLLKQSPMTGSGQNPWLPFDLPSVFSALGNSVHSSTIFSKSGPVMPEAVSNFSAGNITTAEGGISLVTGSGSVYNICGLYNASTNQQSFFAGPEFSGSVFSLALLQDNIGSLLAFVGNNSSGNLSLGISSSYLASLIPSYAFVIGYSGSLNSTADLAARAASSVASQLGVSEYIKLLSLSTSSTFSGINTNGIQLSLYLYVGVADFGRSASKASSGIMNGIGNGAVSLLMKNSYSTGYAVPGAGSSSSTGSMLVLGEINGQDLGSLGQSLFGTGTSVFPPNPASFAVGISMWQNRVHYSTGGYNMTVSNLFGYSGSLDLNSGANLTILAIGHQPFGSSPLAFSSYNISLFVNNASNSEFMAAQVSSSNIFVFPPGQSLSTDAAYSSFSGTFTPDISVSVTGSVSGSNLATLNIMVTNHDTLPLDNVIPVVKGFLDSYNGTMKVIGNGGNVNLGTINPGQSGTASYTLQLYGTGVYYLPPLVVNYTYAGTQYSPSYGSFSLVPGTPSVAYASTTAMAAPLEFIHWSGVYFHLGPLNFFEIIILLLIVLDVYLEYRHYKRWRENRPRKMKGQHPGS